MFGHKNSLSFETPSPPIPGEIAWNKMQTKDVSFKDEKRVTQAECKWEIKRHCIFSQLVSKHCIPMNRCQVKSVQPSVNKLTHLITNNLWTFLSKSNWRWHTAHHPIDFAMVYTATEGEQERVSIRSNVARQKKMSYVLARIYIPGARVELRPHADKFIQVVRTKDGLVTSQVFEVIHDNSHK